MLRLRRSSFTEGKEAGEQKRRRTFLLLEPWSVIEPSKASGLTVSVQEHRSASEGSELW
jgi:hypothetical protein